MPPIDLVVVGAGPRGVIATERLCANVIDLGIKTATTIHLVDPYPAGGGRIWNTDQPRSLLMNTVASDITVFTDSTVQCDGPIVPGPSHYEWAMQVASGDAPATAPTISEAQKTLPWSYPSRPMQGEYLRAALQRIITRAPRNVRVVEHRTAATSFEERGGQYLVGLRDRSILSADAVVLAVGHFDTAPSPRASTLLGAARRLGLTYVPPGNAGEVDLGQVPEHDPVILNGLGLNFFDYVTLLTTGRGGRFVQHDRGELRYIPSGQEPVIIAASRRGVPYLARAEHQTADVARYQPRYITAEVVKSFRQRAHSRAVDFRTEVWPLVEKETAWVYYATLLAQDPAAVSQLTACFDQFPWGAPALAETLDRLVPTHADRLDWATIDRPADNLHFRSRAAYTQWVSEKLDSDYRASEQGPTTNALKAVGAIMRDLRDEVRQIISHQGISGESYRDHIDNWFSGLNNLIASGPPRSRIAELSALARAGIITFAGPHARISVDETAHCFTIGSPSVTEDDATAHTLIDAFLPKNDIRSTTDPLLTSMVASGHCRAHLIPTTAGQPYETGGIDVDDQKFRVLKADGTPHQAVHSYGPPIESVQWVTAIGARPGVNSRTLLQADAIARSILNHVTDLSRNTSPAGVQVPVAP
ncbi:FAD/NAD(P)-binding protein [Nocardia thailandica]|uniref:FAD/NAD(P)-binding protein n=1 Tax=Nocardia thailandica TaxID=257275 RepID=UPI0002E291A4|nr:FAD/NAD(P)-binding protein [Nocardia thailandica]